LMIGVSIRVTYDNIVELIGNSPKVSLKNE
jgi:putative transposon-encoded protein